MPLQLCPPQAAQFPNCCSVPPPCVYRRDHEWKALACPTDAQVTHGVNSRFFVVDSEADEVSVVWGAVAVPGDDNVVLPGVGGGEVQRVALTWAQGIAPPP